jgi:hypothetical protein
MIEIIYTNGPCGACPVQAEGFVDGFPFYFRSRGETWSLSISTSRDVDALDDENCLFYSEDYEGKNRDLEASINDDYIFSAGYAERDECIEFIERAAKILLNKQ